MTIRKCFQNEIYLSGNNRKNQSKILTFSPFNAEEDIYRIRKFHFTFFLERLYFLTPFTNHLPTPAIPNLLQIPTITSHSVINISACK